jgi:hypothetical protein
MRSAVRVYGRFIVAFAVSIVLLSASMAAAQRKAPAGRKSAAEVAADVVRTTKEYRATLVRALPALEANVQEATETLYERRDLHALGILSAEHVTAAEQAWAAAERSLTETRIALDEANRIIVEASVQQELARRAPLSRGGYEDSATLIRFNGPARWSLEDVPPLDERFLANFGRRLPISSFGQTKVHDRLGLDHRTAVDVAVHPDSAEGRWLMQHLRSAGIPFIGVRSEVPGTSTGAHVHIGPPSLRFAAR